MADVDIKYKGTSIATMNASGTKTLETQGKYCEDGITIEYTDPEKPTQTKSVTPTESAQTVTPDSGKLLSSVSVGAIPSNYVGSGVTRKPAATYTPTTTDQTIASGQYLEGAQTVEGDANLVSANIKEGVSIFGVTGTHSGGTTPSGSVTITENGTYDVTDKASAVVALPYTYKRWVYTNATRISADSTVKLVTDSWLAQHRDDTNLEVTARVISQPDGTASEIFWVYTTAWNASLTSNKSHDQIITRLGNNGSYAATNGGTLSGVLPNTRGQLKLNTSGELHVKIDSNAQMEAGDYEIIARLIPTT